MAKLDDPLNPRYHHLTVDNLDSLIEDTMDQFRLFKVRHKVANKFLIVSVGHSLGVVVIWFAEIKFPGTFAGLTLFEPPSNFTGPERVVPCLNHIATTKLMIRFVT